MSAAAMPDPLGPQPGVTTWTAYDTSSPLPDPLPTLGDLLVQLLAQVTELRAEVCELRAKVKELEHMAPV